ncbi:MAG: FAD-dependent oxidoreductase [Steroidobacteraceae bacterium]
MSDSTVVVIGGGVIGLCIAWFARQAGFEVTVLERSTSNHSGCSLGNAGQIVPSHFEPLSSPVALRLAVRSLFDRASPLRVEPRLDPAWLRFSWHFLRHATARHVARSAPLLRDLSLLSRELYTELDRQWQGGFGFAPSGLLSLCESQGSLEAETAAIAHARSLGIAAEPVSRADLARLEPELRYQVAGAVLYSQDACLEPDRLHQQLERRLHAAGVPVLHEHEAVQFRVDRGNVRDVMVRSPQGEQAMRAAQYVIAAGAFSPALARTLGARLVIEAGKGISVTLDSPAVLPRHPAIMVDSRVAVTPMGRRLRFAGTMQFAGLDSSIPTARLAPMLAAVARHVPDISLEALRAVPAWAGLRPCTPDGLPLLGRLSRFDNVVIASGHAMLGVSLGAVTGRLGAQLLARQTPAIALQALDPERFG